MRQEIWKTVPNFPKYQVSSLGNVQGPIKRLKPQIDRDGYPHVTLCHDGRQKQFLLNRLVCEVFHPESYFEDARALHKNHIPEDCSADNLYWGNQSQNMIDMVEAGRCKAPSAAEHYSTRSTGLTWEKVREIRRRAATESGASLAREFGIGTMTCNNIINQRSWKETTDETE